jgi:hypothetical protein
MAFASVIRDAICITFVEKQQQQQQQQQRVILKFRNTLFHNSQPDIPPGQPLLSVRQLPL